MKMVTSAPPVPAHYKICYLVFDVGGIQSRLLERFRDVDNAYEFSENKAVELGRKCLVREASVESHLKLIDERYS